MKKIIVTIICLFAGYLLIEYSASSLPKFGQVIVEEITNFLKIFLSISAVISAIKYWRYTNSIIIGASLFFCGGLAWKAFVHALYIYHTGYVSDILTDMAFNILGAGLVTIIQYFIIFNAWKNKCRPS